MSAPVTPCFSVTDKSVRRVLRTDARQLAAIYAPYVRDTAITFETEPPDAAEMATRIATLAPQYPWLVFDDPDEGILGYAYASPYHTRAAYRSSVSVSVYIRQDARDRGLGRTLMNFLMKELQADGYHRAYALIALPNHASIGLHNRLGFHQVGLLEESGHKLGRWHSVAILEYAFANGGDCEVPLPFRRSETEAALCAWRNGPFFDVDVRKAIDALPGEEQADRFSRALSFGTAGLRGKIGVGPDRMNRYTVARATQALALYLNQTQTPDRVCAGVVLAHDTRHDSDLFARTAAGVLAAHGIPVYRLPGTAPTPLLSFSVRHRGCAAGIMITASHNPPEYNGYKVYRDDGTQISRQDADGILSLMQDESRCGYGVLQQADYNTAQEDGRIVLLGIESEQAYLESLRTYANTVDPDFANVPPEAKDALRVVYTPLHGTGASLVPGLLRSDGFSGVAPVAEQMDPDPDFSTLASPNPEYPEAFALAQRMAEKSSADLVLATDPDADRFAMMIRDNHGKLRFLDGNQTGALLVSYLFGTMADNDRLPEHASLITTVVTDTLGATIAKSYGAEVRTTLTGFKNICGQIPLLQKEGRTYIMGYEESIGYAFGTDVRDKDGLMASLLACRAAVRARQQGRSLWDMLLSLWVHHGYHASRPLQIKLDGADGAQRVQAVLDALRQRPPLQIADGHLTRLEDLESGTVHVYSEDDQKPVQAQAWEGPKSRVLRFQYTNGLWFAIRPSGTEPKLKIYLYAVRPVESGDGSDSWIREQETQTARLLDAAEQVLRPYIDESNG